MDTNHLRIQIFEGIWYLSDYTYHSPKTSGKTIPSNAMIGQFFVGTTHSQGGTKFIICRNNFSSQTLNMGGQPSAST